MIRIFQTQDRGVWAVYSRRRFMGFIEKTTVVRAVREAPSRLMASVRFEPCDLYYVRAYPFLSSETKLEGSDLNKAIQALCREAATHRKLSPDVDAYVYGWPVMNAYTYRNHTTVDKPNETD